MNERLTNFKKVKNYVRKVRHALDVRSFEFVSSLAHVFDSRAEYITGLGSASREKASAPQAETVGDRSNLMADIGKGILPL
jgi:hypothetical protein